MAEGRGEMKMRRDGELEVRFHARGSRGVVENRINMPTFLIPMLQKLLHLNQKNGICQTSNIR